MWRRLPAGARSRLRPVLGLPDPAMPPPPPGPVPVAGLEELRARLDALRGAAPADRQAHYDALCALCLAPPPEAAAMRALDPFSAEYAALAMALAARLRGRDAYDPAADEVLGHALGDPWRLSPWEFGDPALVAEFMDAHGAMLRQLACRPPGRVLEYGPGSGQFLLNLARMGYRCHAADVEPEYLRVIAAQAAAMGVEVRTERAHFGEGFAGERFDAVVFFEAFHHAADFPALLRRLRGRVAPGGRLLLCGEPIFPDGLTAGAIPYPWGPRLDALAVEAFGRGWMELGFQTGFLLEAFRRAGWHPTLVHHPATFRAHVVVATVNQEFPDEP